MRFTKGPLTGLKVQIRHTDFWYMSGQEHVICLPFDMIHAASIIAFGLRSPLSRGADAFLLQPSQQLMGASFLA